METVLPLMPPSWSCTAAISASACRLSGGAVRKIVPPSSVLRSRADVADGNMVIFRAFVNPLRIASASGVEAGPVRQVAPWSTSFRAAESAACGSVWLSADSSWNLIPMPSACDALLSSSTASFNALSAGAPSAPRSPVKGSTSPIVIVKLSELFDDDPPPHAVRVSSAATPATVMGLNRLQREPLMSFLPSSCCALPPRIVGVGNDDDLAERAPLLELGDPLAHSAERQNLVDDRPKAPILDETDELDEVVARPAVGTPNVDLAHPQVAQVSHGVVATRCAAADEAAALADGAQRLRPRVLPGVVDDDIGAGLVGQRPHLFAELPVGCDDHVVRAELTEPIRLGLAPGASDDARSGELAQLDAADADAAGRADHDDRLAGLQRGARVEHPPGGTVRDRQGGETRQVGVVRQGNQIFHGGGHVFGQAAAHGLAQHPDAVDHGINQHRSSNVDSMRRRPEFLHPAGDVAAADVREGHREARHAAADKDVEVVHRARADADQGLALLRHRAVERLHRDLLRPSVLADQRRLHGAPSLHGG